MRMALWRAARTCRHHRRFRSRYNVLWRTMRLIPRRRIPTGDIRNIYARTAPNASMCRRGTTLQSPLFGDIGVIPPSYYSLWKILSKRIVRSWLLHPELKQKSVTRSSFLEIGITSVAPWSLYRWPNSASVYFVRAKRGTIKRRNVKSSTNRSEKERVKEINFLFSLLDREGALIK